MSVVIERSKLRIEEVSSGTLPEVTVSVVVAVSERPEPLAELYAEYAAPLQAAGREFEFVFVTTPGYRDLTAPLRELRESGASVRVLEVGQEMGEAGLLKAAVEWCRGGTVVTLPSYRRVEASTLPELIARVEDGIDLVVARRWPRRDPWINRLQHRVLHALVQRTLGGELHDLGCGVRAFRRDLLEDVPLYGDFSRFLPLIALREGYRVEEVSAPQHPADRKRRIYSPGIYLRRLLDTAGLYFLIRFREKPLRFFGLLGSLLAIVGGVVLGVLAVERLGGRAMADRPLLLLGVLFIVLGIQMFALGLVGEIIVHLNARRGPSYRVRPPEEAA